MAWCGIQWRMNRTQLMHCCIGWSKMKRIFAQTRLFATGKKPFFLSNKLLWTLLLKEQQSSYLMSGIKISKFSSSNSRCAARVKPCDHAQQRQGDQNFAVQWRLQFLIRVGRNKIWTEQDVHSDFLNGQVKSFGVSMVQWHFFCKVLKHMQPFETCYDGWSALHLTCLLCSPGPVVVMSLR